MLVKLDNAYYMEVIKPTENLSSCTLSFKCCTPSLCSDKTPRPWQVAEPPYFHNKRVFNTIPDSRSTMRLAMEMRVQLSPESVETCAE